LPVARLRVRAKHAVIVAALLAALLALGACGTQENYGLGVVFLEEAGGGVQYVALEGPSRASEYQLAQVPGFPGQVTTFLVGSRPGFLARGAVRFDRGAMPAVGTVVDSAFVELVFREGFGDRDTLLIDVFAITSDWTDTDSLFTFPSHEAVPRLTVDRPFAGPTGTADTLRLPLTELVQEWVNDAGVNLGIALVPAAGQDSEIEFVSRQGAEPPRLIVYSNDGAEVAVSTPVATADSFVLETTVAHVPPVGLADRLTLARGLPARILLDFDLPAFGERVTIHRAELVLRMDPASSVTNGYSAGVQRVTSETWSGETTQADPVLNGLVSFAADSDSVVFPITGVTRLLVSDGSLGIQVRALEERADTDVVRFFGPGTDRPPSLRIWYTPGSGEGT